jgi:hypothetical protein
VGMYQNQSCYIWGDEHPFTSYLMFTRGTRFWHTAMYPQTEVQFYQSFEHVPWGKLS